jgi:DNA-binding NarL/FixJ family response regulator
VDLLFENSQHAPPDAIRVLLLTDVRFYSDWLATTLSEHPAIGTVVLASDLSSAMKCIAQVRPHVVALETTTALRCNAIPCFRAAETNLLLVAFGVPETDTDILTCAELGLDGYVARDGTIADLIAAIVGACRGELHCSARVAATLFRHVATLASARVAQAAPAPLTRRELQIARLLEQGLSNKEIARRISVEYATVKNHVHHILEKLQVRKRGEAVARLRALL